MKYFLAPLFLTVMFLPSLSSAEVLPLDPDGDGVVSASCTPQPDFCSPQPDLCVPGAGVCDGEGESVICTPGPDVCTPQPEICTPMPDQCVLVLPPVGDNCPTVANADQLNTDADQMGDVCDETPNAESILRVVVEMINDSGATMVAGNVNVHVKLAPEAPAELSRKNFFSRIARYFGIGEAHAADTLVAPADFLGSAEGTDVLLNTPNKSYMVTIDPFSGYSLSMAGCPDGTLSTNTLVVCRIVLDDNFGNGFGNYPSLPNNVDGCTDPLATNFRSDNTRNDGSCIYATTATGTVLGVTTDTPEIPLPLGCSPYLKAYLKQGRKNDPEEVKKLQTILNEELGAELPVTGFFGNLTKRWVKMYQKKFESEILKPWVDAGYGERGGLAASGYAFITTRRHINIAKCESLKSEPMPELKPDVNP